ncbi:uncharacterized protein V1516DRAFT_133791 [Lipomyces oligophaga]|uniref:uncharacterized protein n=1 Tax=Lipomyces oligophaga TaxID=45792 RepID=UPI0034CE21B8
MDESDDEAQIEAKSLLNPPEADEDVFIPLDLSKFPQNLENTSNFQLRSLNSDHPLVAVGSKVYEGDWNDLVGTDMFFDQDGHVLGVSRTQITLNPGKLISKDDRTESSKSGKFDGVDWKNPKKKVQKRVTLLEKMAKIDEDRKNKET